MMTKSILDKTISELLEGMGDISSVSIIVDELSELNETQINYLNQLTYSASVDHRLKNQDIKGHIKELH